MKRLLSVVSAILLTWAVATAQPDSVVVLHTSDTHAHLMPYGPKDVGGNWQWGGFARLATAIGMTRMEAPNVLLLDAGDFSVGDFMFQEYLSIAQLQIMQALQYDAIALGNHEFDLYPSTLKYMLNEAGFPNPNLPLISANLDLTGDPELGYFVQPYTIKEYGNTRVGIASLLTESANQISNPSPVVVLNEMAEAQRWIDTLNAHDCDVVILLTHIGYQFDCILAQMVTGVDIIVGGHSHTLTTTPTIVNGILIVHPGEFANHLGRLSLVVDEGTITNWEYLSIPLDASIPEEPTLKAMIEGLAAGVEADPRFGPVYSEDIAAASTDLTKVRGEGLLQDTPLGDIIADAFREQTGTDIAFQPQGFCNETIFAGPVRGADIFRAVPYGFDQVTGLGLELVTFETNGMSLMAGLEFSVYNMPYSEDFILHGSGISYAYNTVNPPGARVDYASIRINGQPIDPMGIYSVTTSDATAGFISQIPGFWINNFSATDLPVYTVLKDYLVANSPAGGFVEGRLIDLAQYADPLVGAGLLKDVIKHYGEIGWISRAVSVKSWMADLGQVERFLKRGKPEIAYRWLESFKLWVGKKTPREVDPFASQQLIYLATKLEESIMPAPQAAAAKTIIPAEFSLGQNYPNPFNPTTEIKFSLPSAGQVSLEVYNILGERVSTLVDGNLPAGEHSVTWNSTNANGTRVASGIYFYRLQAGDKAQTKKMVLLQ